MTTKYLPDLARVAAQFNPKPDEAPVTTTSFLNPIFSPPRTLGVSFSLGTYSFSGSSVAVRPAQSSVAVETAGEEKTDGWLTTAVESDVVLARNVAPLLFEAGRKAVTATAEKQKATSLNIVVFLSPDTRQLSKVNVLFVEELAMAKWNGLIRQQEEAKQLGRSSFVVVATRKMEGCAAARCALMVMCDAIQKQGYLRVSQKFNLCFTIFGWL